MLLSALQVLVGQKESQTSSQFQESPLLGIVPPRALSSLSQPLILLPLFPAPKPRPLSQCAVCLHHSQVHGI